MTVTRAVPPGHHPNKVMRFATPTRTLLVVRYELRLPSRSSPSSLPGLDRERLIAIAQLVGGSALLVRGNPRGALWLVSRDPFAIRTRAWPLRRRRAYDTRHSLLAGAALVVAAALIRHELRRSGRPTAPPAVEFTPAFSGNAGARQAPAATADAR
jgi:hypothetical protein